jgi:hypothetical protein
MRNIDALIDDSPIVAIINPTFQAHLVMHFISCFQIKKNKPD